MQDVFLTEKNIRVYGNKTLFFCLLALFFLSGCSSIVRYQNIAIDTPSRHVDNGMKFLEINKIDAAIQEFCRAIELDPDYAKGYLGLGLGYGRLGNFEKGYDFMEKARIKARAHEEESAVKNAKMLLDAMKKKSATN